MYAWFEVDLGKLTSYLSKGPAYGNVTGKGIVNVVRNVEQGVTCTIAQQIDNKRNNCDENVNLEVKNRWKS